MRNLHEREIIAMEKSFALNTRRAIIRYASEILSEEGAMLYFIFLDSKINLQVFYWYLPEEGLTINLFGNLGKYRV